jgi:CheY-like chemotaxis protein
MLKWETYSRSLSNGHSRGAAASQEGTPVSAMRTNNILVVDDNSSVRETMALVLASEGYEVSTAKDGLDALFRFKTGAPDLLLSDLEMPRMSGFELLSVVRRRFPTMVVVAMSGTHEGDTVPAGVLADAFYAKGRNEPEKLLRIVADLFRTSAARVSIHAREQAPIWAPRISKDATGTSYVLLTCPECLRSFSLATPEAVTTILDTECVFCLSDIRYMVGSPVSGLPSRSPLDNVTCITQQASRFASGETKLHATAKGR